MHLLIDKKNKIIIYLLLLLTLSTTNGKFAESQNNLFSTNFPLVVLNMNKSNKYIIILFFLPIN